MQSALLKSTVLMLAIATGAANAAPTAKIPAAAPAPTPASFGELDALRSQNAILAEKVKAAEMQAKLLGTNQSKSLSGLPPFPAAAPAAARGMKDQFEDFGTTSAQVQMVSDSGNSTIAVISLPRGGRVTARVGSIIPHLGVVKSISLNEVVVANKKQTFSIPFAAEPFNMPSGNPGTYSQPPVSMAMPPLPMRGNR